ncbi:MAG TPA: ABC transporter permease [Thermomicrobiaceae bacterium]|nr:ABC transporter permease [Thermomicrobiaceae bacterium]
MASGNSSIRAESKGTKRQKQAGGGGFSRLATSIGLPTALIVVVVVFSIIKHSEFDTFGNLGTILGSQAVSLVVTLGLMFALIAGEWDLSIGGTLGLSLTLTGYLNASEGVSIWVSILVALLAGLAVGTVNALVIVRLRVPSLVATLGMATLLQGVVYGISDLTISGLNPSFVQFGEGEVVKIPYLFFVAIGIAIVVFYVLRYTPFGRYLYFVGASHDVATLAGIRVNRIRTLALMISGFMSSLAGVLLAASLGSTGPSIGPGYLLPAFAAAFLGATTIDPGRFNVWGTVVAVYFLVTGVTGLELLGASSAVQDMFYGGILIVAVALTEQVGTRVRAVVSGRRR